MILKSRCNKWGRILGRCGRCNRGHLSFLLAKCLGTWDESYPYKPSSWKPLLTSNVPWSHDLGHGIGWMDGWIDEQRSIQWEITRFTLETWPTPKKWMNIHIHLFTWKCSTCIIECTLHVPWNRDHLTRMPSKKYPFIHTKIIPRPSLISNFARVYIVYGI